MAHDEFEVENAEIRTTMNAISKKVGNALPAGWGFALMLFEFGTEQDPGALFYASSADRAGVIAMLKAWIQRKETEQETISQEIEE